MPVKKKKPAKKKPIKKATLKRPVKKAVRRKIVRTKVIRRKGARTKHVSHRAAPAAKARKTAAKKVAANVVGEITHYFPKVMAAVLKAKQPLSVDDTIKIKGHTTDFTQKITSMQIDHVVVTQVKKGAEIGLQVVSRVRKGDIVSKVTG